MSTDGSAYVDVVDDVTLKDPSNKVHTYFKLFQNIDLTLLIYFFTQGCSALPDRIPLPSIQTTRYVKVTVLKYSQDGPAFTYIGIETVVGE